MEGYHIVISSRPSHSCELRLNAYLVSPNGTQVVIYGHNNLFSDNEKMLRRAIKINWPGLPITRDDSLYVIGVDPVPETLEKFNP